MINLTALTAILQAPGPMLIELCILLELLVGIILLAPVCVPIVMPPIPLEAMLDCIFMIIIFLNWLIRSKMIQQNLQPNYR